MKSAKQKGSQGERDVVGLFWQAGWSAHRIAGSGSNKFPSPDVIAGTPLRKIAIELKITKDTSKYLTNEEIQGLIDFSNIFGAEPWVGVKFGREPWLFFTVEDLNKTEKSYKITIQDRHKAFLFEELIRTI